MIRATLRTPAIDKQAQAAITPVAPTVHPATRSPAPAPALVPALAPAVIPVKAPIARPAVKTAPPATPTMIPVKPPVSPRKLAIRPVTPVKLASPIIDVQTEIVPTSTPVEDVTIDSINTSASVSVEDQLLPPAHSVETLEFEAGCKLALDPAGILPDNASQALIRGWNSILVPKLENTVPVEASQSKTAPVETSQSKTVPAETSQAVAVCPPSSISNKSNYTTGRAFIGDYNQSDVRLPQLKIVQGSGPLSQQFNDGTILFADQELLPPADLKVGAVNPVLRFVPVQLIKQYREAISREDQENGMMPRTANSAREVEDEFGGTVQWGNGEQPANYWKPSSKNLIVLEMPEGSTHPSFVMELDGKFYAPAIYYAAGVAYTSFHLVVLNTSATLLQSPVLDADGQPQKDETGHVVKEPVPHRNFWTMGFARKTLKKSDFTPWAPIVKLLSRETTGPELREYCESLISSQVAAREVSQGE